MISISVTVKTYDLLTDPRLGRVLEHDEQSRLYAYKAVQAVIKSIRWARVIPTFDQGQVGSCTGNAATGCLGTEPFYDTVKDILAQRGIVLDETEAVSVYSKATQVDNIKGTYPPDDTGSSGLAVAKVLTSLGLISGYTHSFTFDDLLAALQNHPVIVGTDWYSDMFNPDANGILSVSGSIAGGHEYIIDEVDVERQVLGMQNSWGESWGLNGRAYIRFADMKKLLADGGDVTVFVPVNVPAPVPTPTPSPVPTPTPPTPVPGDADATLWQALKTWAGKRHTGSNKTAVKNVLAWASEKGYTE